MPRATEWLARSQALPARLIRFALVGGATSATYVLVVAGLVAYVTEAVAAAVAYLMLLPFNFIGHRRATFRSRATTRSELARYLALHGITMATCAGVMALATTSLGTSHWAGSAVIVVLAPIVNFVLLDRWVFRFGKLDG